MQAQPVNNVRPRAEASGTAIAALICAFVIPPLGIILGHVARGEAKARGMQPSPVATWGCILGYIFTVIYAVIVISVAVAAVQTANNLPNPSSTCDISNPDWPNC